ncbi:hypothetical protein BpHYR1_020048, partial [Brachionus plicatilis]
MIKIQSKQNSILPDLNNYLRDINGKQFLFNFLSISNHLQHFFHFSNSNFTQEIYLSQFNSDDEISDDKFAEESRHIIDISLKIYGKSSFLFFYRYTTNHKRSHLDFEMNKIYDQLQIKKELAQKTMLANKCADFNSKFEEHKISRETVRRVLAKKGKESNSAVKKPLLTLSDRIKRYKWCKDKRNLTDKDWAK